MLGFLTKEILYIALLSGVITTFAVSALNAMQNKLSTNWLVFVFSLVITLASIQLDFCSIESIQEFILKVILTMSFSVLFYNYLGKWFIDSIFRELKNFLRNKIVRSDEKP